MIDYVFRFDPAQPESKQTPANAEEARLALIAGNRVFSEWMATCRLGDDSASGAQYVVPCGGEQSLIPPGDGYPVQKPFAVVLGCADARVPTEMLFGQGFNDLFVVRVAGNVISDSVQGSIDFSLQALSESVRVLVALGHTNCGAVSAAVKVVKENARLPGHLPELVDAIKPAVRIAQGKKGGNLVADATIENVRLNVHRLMVSRPIIGELVKAGKVGVTGGVYDLATGKINLV